MGAQSVLVRLLMKGIPQTNVMTGNMTQLGIALTDICHGAAPASPEAATTSGRLRNTTTIRDQLLVVLAVAAGFLVGAAAGAVAFVTIGVLRRAACGRDCRRAGAVDAVSRGEKGAWPARPQRRAAVLVVQMKKIYQR